MPRPIRATISSAALKHNLEIARRHAGGSKIWAVIKANGYGHGLMRVAKALDGADGFALLDFVDALRLRAAGVDKPILMLEGFFSAQDLPVLEKYALTPVIHTVEQIEMLKTTDLGGQIDAYLKVNSGMNRLGFSPDNVRLGWNALQEDPQIRAVDADDPLRRRRRRQRGAGPTRLVRRDHAQHGCAAQRGEFGRAAALSGGDARRTGYGPGIMLYGCSPFRRRERGRRLA